MTRRPKRARSATPRTTRRIIAVKRPRRARPRRGPRRHHGRGPEDRIPLAGLRRKIAQKMAQSTATAAHFTFVEECDVTDLKALRARLLEPAAAARVKLSFLPFIVKAVVAGLKKHPMLNTTLDEATNEIVFRRFYNIGIATATEAGLIVPVVKHADQRSVLDVAREDRPRVPADAQAGKLDHEARGPAGVHLHHPRRSARGRAALATGRSSTSPRWPSSACTR